MDTNDSPVMAVGELRELLAAEQAWKRVWYESRNTLGQEYRDWSVAHRRLSDAALDALPGLLDEVDRLQAAHDALTGERFSDRCHAALKSRAEQAEARASALLARCEGLEAALNEVAGCFSAALTEGWIDAIENGDIERIRDLWQRRISYALIAATRTTGAGS